MSIEQTEVIDAIGINDLTGDVILTITDYFEWINNDPKHLNLIQEKLNTYLRFIESGEIINAYPDAKNRAVLIDVIYKYPLVKEAIIFYNQVALIIENAGVKFTHRLFLDQ